MQRSNWDNAKNLVAGDEKQRGAYTDVSKYGLQMQQLARGGLLNLGVNQLNQGLSAPSIGPGMAARNAQRYGVNLTPEQQSALKQQAAMTDASTRTAVLNQGRRGLYDTMMNMRFGGLT